MVHSSKGSTKVKTCLEAFLSIVIGREDVIKFMVVEMIVKDEGLTNIKCVVLVFYCILL